MDEYLEPLPDGPAHPDLDPNGPMPVLPIVIQDQHINIQLDPEGFPQISIQDILTETTVDDPPNLLDYTAVELELLLRTETEAVQEFYDQVATSQVEYDNANNYTVTETPVQRPQITHIPNTLVNISLPTFAGDTAITETERYLNLEIRQLEAEYETSRTHYLFHHKDKKKCKVCNYDCLNILFHVNQGPFAPQHSFSTFDKNIETEILLKSTLRYVGSTLEGVWDTSVKIDPSKCPTVPPMNISKLRSSAKQVPENLILAITNFQEIHCCGEHASTFPSLLSLALHHISVEHTHHTHVCCTCNNVIMDSFLYHQLHAHNKALLKYFTDTLPSLHDIYNYQISDLHNNSTQLSETSAAVTLYQHAELSTSRKGAKLCLTVNDMFRKLPMRAIDLYTKLKELHLNFQDYRNYFCTSDAFPLNILTMMKHASQPQILLAAMEEISRLTHARPAWDGVATFMKTGKFELLQLIYLTRIRYMFHAAQEDCPTTINELKCGIDQFHQLQPTGPTAFSHNQFRLKELTITNYSAITIGTKLLKKSGISTMKRYRLLNLSPNKKSLLTTAGFNNLGFYSAFAQNIPVYPENSFCKHVQKIVEATKSIPVIVEFNLQENLNSIDSVHWDQYLTQHQEQYCLGFCLQIVQIKTKTRPFSRDPRNLILIGQSTLFHRNLDLVTLIRFTDRINLHLQAAALATRIPLVLPSALVGFSGRISIPLLSTPRQPTFTPQGDLTDYSVQQGLRLIFMVLDGLQMLEDVQIAPNHRAHMVPNYI